MTDVSVAPLALSAEDLFAMDVVEALTDALVVAVPEARFRRLGVEVSPGFDARHRYVYREAVRGVLGELMSRYADGFGAAADRHEASLAEAQTAGLKRERGAR